MSMIATGKNGVIMVYTNQTSSLILDLSPNKDLLQIESFDWKFAIIFYRTAEGALKNSVKFPAQNLQFSYESLFGDRSIGAASGLVGWVSQSNNMEVCHGCFDRWHVPPPANVR